MHSAEKVEYWEDRYAEMELYCFSLVRLRRSGCPSLFVELQPPASRGAEGSHGGCPAGEGGNDSGLASWICCQRAKTPDNECPKDEEGHLISAVSGGCIPRTPGGTGDHRGVLPRTFSAVPCLAFPGPAYLRQGGSRQRPEKEQRRCPFPPVHPSGAEGPGFREAPCAGETPAPHPRFPAGQSEAGAAALPRARSEHSLRPCAGPAGSPAPSALPAPRGAGRLPPPRRTAPRLRSGSQRRRPARRRCAPGQEPSRWPRAAPRHVSGPRPSGRQHRPPSCGALPSPRLAGPAAKPGRRQGARSGSPAAAGG
ncbi:translation initiation factor IF-2-like [Vidua chalybeata]|uniref:translation initiation factor IF-2-like n=1 Tax=Vidua chalybeata TaxID=81927 RepID=UPI0023A85FD7|nr:translation initiation factor IF-2-like [Vidua chalybeata]